MKKIFLILFAFISVFAQLNNREKIGFALAGGDKNHFTPGKFAVTKYHNFGIILDLL